VPAGLLVRPLAGEERRHGDPVHERDRRERIGDPWAVVPVAVDLGEQVDGLRVQRLVGLARAIAGADPLERPPLPAARRRGLGVPHPVLRPRQGEPGVEDPARVERRRGRVDHRERRDRRQARRPARRDEELADPAVGEARHPDLAVLHPRLARDRLDHVVAVEPLERLEVVECAAGAARAPHVHVDDRVAQQVEQLRDRALPARRVRVAVAGVLDDGRVGRRAGGEPHVDRELRAVARRQVAVSARRDPLPVALRARWRGAVRQHAHPPGGRRAAPDPVAAAGRDAAEHDAAEPAGPLGAGDPAVA
jgi:hypothetical protein